VDVEVCGPEWVFGFGWVGGRKVDVAFFIVCPVVALGLLVASRVCSVGLVSGILANFHFFRGVNFGERRGMESEMSLMSSIELL